MNKAELVERVWGASRYITQRDAEAVVTAIFNEIAAALLRGDRVELRGFGMFSVRKRGARTGRDPRTGKSIAVGEKHRPFFKTAKQLHHQLQKQLSA
jgi:integration host factor subunit beta